MVPQQHGNGIFGIWLTTFQRSSLLLLLSATRSLPDTYLLSIHNSNQDFEGPLSRTASLLRNCFSPPLSFECFFRSSVTVSSIFSRTWEEPPKTRSQGSLRQLHLKTPNWDVGDVLLQNFSVHQSNAGINRYQVWIEDEIVITFRFKGWGVRPSFILLCIWSFCFLLGCTFTWLFFFSPPKGQWVSICSIWLILILWG